METYRGMVYPNELDHIGHMNVQWYVCKFDQASWHLLAQVGCAPDALRERGKGMAAVQQNIQYISEAMAGDLLYIDSSVLGLSNKTMRFRHTMFNATDHRELATCELVAAFIDLQKRRAEPIPTDIREACEKAIAG